MALSVAFVLALPVTSQSQERQALDDAYFGKAQYHWTVQCQGCHGAEAQGTPGRVPRLAGNVARYLALDAGRAYLGRVPGVAFADLSDADLAVLLNWVVRRFDARHVPKVFSPYSEAEIRALRRDPLISNAYDERRMLLRSLARRP